MADASVFENLYQEELYVVPQRTLVLIDKPWDQLTESEHTLLVKILGSVRLSTAAVQIIHRQNSSITDLLTLHPLRVISFGVAISPVQTPYEFVPLDGVPVIVSESLSALDDAKKKSLWLALRQMFGI